MRGKLLSYTGLPAVLFLSLAAWLSPAQQAEKPPHGQDQPPGPALSPAEAIKKMKVPDGFTVELWLVSRTS